MADTVRDWRFKKPGVHTREVHKEALPAEVVARIEALEQGIADLSSRVLQFVSDFAQHVHAPPAEMAELAQRVQALETLANRRAA
jgi:uncharacterized protein YceH (UPF0502 family)